MPFETDVRENVFAAPAGGAIRPELWLLGQPPLRDYLDFVRDSVVGGDAMDPRALCDEWRVANDRYYELERSEAGYRRRGRVPGAAGGDAAARRRARRATRTSATPATTCRRPSAWSSSTG